MSNTWAPQPPTVRGPVNGYSIFAIKEFGQAGRGAMALVAGTPDSVLVGPSSRQAMTEVPLLRISYQRGKQVRVLAGHGPLPERYIKGVLISDADVQVLRALAARNIIVRLECPNQTTYHGRVPQILKRLVPIPLSGFWYLPTTSTGPLRESGRPV